MRIQFNIVEKRQQVICILVIDRACSRAASPSMFSGAIQWIQLIAVLCWIKLKRGSICLDSSSGYN